MVRPKGHNSQINFKLLIYSVYKLSNPNVRLRVNTLKTISCRFDCFLTRVSNSMGPQPNFFVTLATIHFS